MKYCKIEGNVVEVTIPEMAGRQALVAAVAESAARNHAEGVTFSFSDKVEDTEIQDFCEKVDNAINSLLQLRGNQNNGQ